MRLEQLFAISDYRRFQAHDKTANFEKLIRFHDPDEPEEVTLEDIAKLIGVPYEVKQHGK